MSEPLRYQYGDRTVSSFVQLQRDGFLNLEPGFQRKSVWHPADRRKLIQSVLEGFPIPSIFLYRREENGWPIYDVIDGKQRLETLFMFCGEKGFKRDRFDVKFQFADDDRPYSYDWRDLGRWDLTGRLLTYRIQTVEVSGDLADIVDLFVRINSTGKALVSSEKRHARYYKSPFLQEARRLARRHTRFFKNQGILRERQIGRMKDVELLSELLVSVAHGGLIDRKAAVDRAVGSEGLAAGTLRKASREAGATIAVMRRLFPDLHATRFRNTSEFYSLFMLVWELQKQSLVLADRKRSRAANVLLKHFSNGVDRVRDLQRSTRGAGGDQEIYADYLLSVQQSTDKLSQRTQRAKILRGVFGGLFERKDERRLFTPEQRRILWNSRDTKNCAACGDSLTWTNFQVDHLIPHSGGGRTDLANADLLCGSCNASKGARGRRRRNVPRRRRRSASPRRRRVTRARARRA